MGRFEGAKEMRLGLGANSKRARGEEAREEGTASAK